MVLTRSAEHSDLSGPAFQPRPDTVPVMLNKRNRFLPGGTISDLINKTEEPQDPKTFGDVVLKGLHAHG